MYVHGYHYTVQLGYVDNLLIIAFSRTSRTLPNFVSQARETEIFGLQFGRSSKFLPGVSGLVFVSTGHKTRPGNFSPLFWHLSFCPTY